MATIANQGATDAEWKRFGGGLNTVEDPLYIREGQCHDGSLNFVSRPGSVKRRPGGLGIKTTAVFSALAKGLFEYLQVNGTSKLMGVSGGKLYDVNKTTGAITERFDLTGTGDAYGESYRDKFWCCNGSDVAKVENETGYQVGIDAPSGASAAAVAGGSLPAGDYDVYVSYARKVSGSNVLYSVGQSLGTVSVTAANGTIRISTFANSTDAQVNNKVVWLTDAGGSTLYFYHETNDNTTTTVDVTSDASRNAAITYSVFAAPSGVPPAFQSLHFHDNRLWGIVDNIAYYSLPGATVYDLERFPGTNFNTYPYKINGAFTIGEHLFFSCSGANLIIWQPYGDPDQAFKIVDDRFAFKFIRTVRQWGNGVIGVTQDGVRFFDGGNLRFVDQDLSYYVRKNMDELYSSEDADHQPSAIIYRRSEPMSRTEYVLSYIDSTDNTVHNNRTLRLNLDELKLYGGTQMVAPWDLWNIGFEYAAIDTDGTLFMCQSNSNGGQVYKEDTGTTQDRYIYNSAGTLLSAFTNSTFIYKQRQYLFGLKTRVEVAGMLYVLLQSTKGVTARAVFRDQSFRTETESVDPAGGDVALFNVALFDQAVFPSESPTVLTAKFQYTLWGKVLHVEYEQSDNDRNMEIFQNLIELEFHQDRTT